MYWKPGSRFVIFLTHCRQNVWPQDNCFGSSKRLTQIEHSSDSLNSLFGVLIVKNGIMRLRTFETQKIILFSSSISKRQKQWAFIFKIDHMHSFWIIFAEILWFCTEEKRKNEWKEVNFKVCCYTKTDLTLYCFK